jgi:acid stress chaperone HdeB
MRPLVRLRSPSGFVYQCSLSNRPAWFCRHFIYKNSFNCGADAPPGEIIMKTTVSTLFAAALMLSSMPAHAVVLDLSTLTCKQFIEGGDDEIKMVLTWMDGWYKGDEDEAIIDTDVFVDNAKKFGAFCAANPTISIVNAAEKILGK